MKIISSWRDYYDGIQGYGLDERLVYERKEKEIFDDEIIKKYNPYRDRIRKYSIHKMYVGFCGILYPLIIIKENSDSLSYINRNKQNRSVYEIPLNELFIYDHREIPEALKKAGMTNLLEEYHTKHPNYRRWHIEDERYRKPFCKQMAEKFLIEQPFEKIFIENKVPCFIISQNTLETRNDQGRWVYKKEIILNPTLADYHFYKRFDAFSTFQEIAQYMSGVLGLNDPEIVSIDDKYLQQQKGFDQWSFKKMPTKKNH